MKSFDSSRRKVCEVSNYCRRKVCEVWSFLVGKVSKFRSSEVLAGRKFVKFEVDNSRRGKFIEFRILAGSQSGL